MPLNDCQVNGCHPLPEEICNSCSYIGQKVLPVFEHPPVLLRGILTSNERQGRHFGKNTRQCNKSLAMTSVRADFVSRGSGFSKYNPTAIIHGRMYHKIGAKGPANGMMPRYAPVYVHDTEHATSNRKQFYGGL